jgi:hypothetical protein
MLCGTLDRDLGGFFPRLAAGADQFDDFVGTLGHGGTSFFMLT